jgi:hypothetical protein
MKHLLLVLVAFSIICCVQAQKIFTFGPLIGYTSSTLDNSTFSNNNPGSGYALGGFVRVDIKKCYLQPNIYYLNNTSSFDYNQTTTNTNLKSVTGDLLVGYRLFKFTDLTYVRIFAGPSYSNINKLQYKNGDPTLSPNYSSSNILLNAGVGFDFWKLTFDLRYQRGLTDIDKSANSMHTNTFMLTAGFKIL